MNPSFLNKVVDAVLYEGFILYPYRPSSKKNRRGRFTFGRVYPEAYSAAQNGAEPCVMQTECLAQTRTNEAALDVSVRFLHPMWREVGLLSAPLREWIDGVEPEFQLAQELRMDGHLFQTWQEAVEREVRIPEMLLGAAESLWFPLSFPA